MASPVQRRIEGLLLENYRPSLNEKNWLLSQEESIRKTENSELIRLWERAKSNLIEPKEEKLIKDVITVLEAKRGKSPLKTSGELRDLEKDVWKQFSQIFDEDLRA